MLVTRSLVQVGDLAQLDDSEAPKEGHVRVYLVPTREDAAAEPQRGETMTAEAMLQVRPARFAVHAVQSSFGAQSSLGPVSNWCPGLI